MLLEKEAVHGLYHVLTAPKEAAPQIETDCGMEIVAEKHGCHVRFPGSAVALLDGSPLLLNRPGERDGWFDVSLRVVPGKPVINDVISIPSEKAAEALLFGVDPEEKAGFFEPKAPSLRKGGGNNPGSLRTALDGTVIEAVDPVLGQGLPETASSVPAFVGQGGVNELVKLLRLFALGVSQHEELRSPLGFIGVKLPGQFRCICIPHYFHYS